MATGRSGSRRSRRPRPCPTYLRCAIVGAPRDPGDLAAAAELLVALGHRRPGDRALPPGEAADPDRPGAAGDRHVGIGERVADVCARTAGRRSRRPGGAAPAPRGRRARRPARGAGCSCEATSRRWAARAARRAGVGQAPDAGLGAAGEHVAVGDRTAIEDHRLTRTLKNSTSKESGPAAKPSSRPSVIVAGLGRPRTELGSRAGAAPTDSKPPAACGADEAGDAVVELRSGRLTSL